MDFLAFTPSGCVYYLPTSLLRCTFSGYLVFPNGVVFQFMTNNKNKIWFLNQVLFYFKLVIQINFALMKFIFAFVFETRFQNMTAMRYYNHKTTLWNQTSNYKTRATIELGRLWLVENKYCAKWNWLLNNWAYAYR